MPSRKAETETSGSSVSKGAAKSAIVGTDTYLAEAKASSEPSYEAITQQITYLMSAVANQVKPELTKPSGHLGSNPIKIINIPPIHSRGPSMIKEHDLLGMWGNWT